MSAVRSAVARVAAIPAIDLAAFSEPSCDANRSCRAAAARELDAAASQVGFFHMRLPGLAEAAQRLLSRCKEFHAQPAEAKSAVASSLSPLYRGERRTECAPALVPSC